MFELTLNPLVAFLTATIIWASYGLTAFKFAVNNFKAYLWLDMILAISSLIFFILCGPVMLSVIAVMDEKRDGPE
jgi:hypothetical protein